MPLPSTDPKSSMERADRPTIRGKIDVLLVDKNTVEIVDYKTDVPAMIQSRLPFYRQQMFYYARAVEDILGRKVNRATLVFLAARRIEIIESPAAD